MLSEDENIPEEIEVTKNELTFHLDTCMRQAEY